MKPVTLGVIIGNRGFFPDHLCISGRKTILKVLADEGISVNIMQVVTVWPFPTQEVRSFLDGAKVSMVIEGNFTGQLEGLIRQECLLAPHHHLRRHDGRPFSYTQIADAVREVAR